MDLGDFDIKVLLLVAIKSEIEAKETYSSLANRVSNAFLKERLEFLASEEDKHRETLEGIFRMRFPDEEMVIPDVSPVPLPEVNVDSENDPISLVLESAMESELAAEDFYSSMVDMFEDRKVKDMLEILSQMEHAHYTILKAEYENMKRFEDYDSTWPMMHSGP